MKYTLNFPHLDTSDKVTVIKAMRQLCPGLGIKDAKDMTERGGNQVLDIGAGGTAANRHEALTELRNYGVLITERIASDGPQARSWPITDTVGDIRTVAIAALDRGEYDIAIALIQMIRDFK